MGKSTYCGKTERKWKAKGWGIMFGGEGGDEYRFSAAMWADRNWIRSDERYKLTWMVNDITEELMDLDMEPKLELLLRTST